MLVGNRIYSKENRRREAMLMEQVNKEIEKVLAE